MDEKSSYFNDLKGKLEAQQAVVGIVGLGYVGLPLAQVLCGRGFRTLGFDIDERKVAQLTAGKSYLNHVDLSDLLKAGAEGRFEATADMSRLAEADAVLICVPTPLTPQRTPDLRAVKSTAEDIARTLRGGMLIVLESTTYPTTTEDLLRRILESSGKRAGEDFFLAFSPEREDPGNATHSTSNTPKVVGGVDEASGILANILYQQVTSKTVLVSNARTAEATKLTENVFRSVNIALVNELKIIFDAMDINVWEVLDAAETKPFGFMRFNPGPGWGGHCIPLDPFYLGWKAKECGVEAKFIELAGEVNRQMSAYVLEKTLQALNERGKAMRGSKVLVLGMAYKKNVGDARESPAFEIIDRLLHWGADVAYHDPHIPVAPLPRSWPDIPQLESVELTAERLASSDAVLLVTDHAAVDYNFVAEHSSVIIDTRGVYLPSRPNVVKA